MTIDTRSERSTLASVTHAAWEENGWDVLAVKRVTEPDADQPPVGVIAFVYTDTATGPAYGTAYWNAAGLRINFDWGHYDLSHDDAMQDFAKREGS